MNQVIWDRLARELKKVVARKGEAYRIMIQRHLEVGYKYNLSTEELES